MNQPLTPERLAETREFATRAARSSYEALTSQRGIEIFAVDPDDCKERIATTQYDRKDFVYLAVQAPTVVLALLDDLDRRTEDVAFLERNTMPELRREIQHHQDGKQRWRDRAEKAEAERDELKKRLNEAAMTKTWTNEDGKKFVFVEDIAPPLLGLDR